MEFNVKITVSGGEESDTFDLQMYADSLEELSEEIYTLLME